MFTEGLITTISRVLILRTKTYVTLRMYDFWGFHSGDFKSSSSGLWRRV